jgi:hypothetical protein
MVKKSRRRHKKAMGKQKKALTVDTTAAQFPADIAIRLLYVQQRIDALERLYNEEVSSLRQDVSAMKLAFVRQAQAQGRLEGETGPPEPEPPEDGDLPV